MLLYVLLNVVHYGLPCGFGGAFCFQQFTLRVRFADCHVRVLPLHPPFELHRSFLRSLLLRHYNVFLLRKRTGRRGCSLPSVLPMGLGAPHFNCTATRHRITSASAGRAGHCLRKDGVFYLKRRTPSLDTIAMTRFREPAVSEFGLASFHRVILPIHLRTLRRTFRFFFPCGLLMPVPLRGCVTPSAAAPAAVLVSFSVLVPDGLALVSLRRRCPSLPFCSRASRTAVHGRRCLADAQ